MTKQDKFQNAITNKDIINVSQLINEENIDPSENSNWAIQYACENDCYKLVKLLLNDKRVNPADKDNQAIIWASKYGYVNIVELLLSDKRVNPIASKNRAFEWAYMNNTFSVANKLSKNKNESKQSLINGKINATVELLWKDKRVNNYLQINNPNIHNTLSKHFIKNKVHEF